MQGNPKYQGEIISQVLSGLQQADPLAQQVGAQLLAQLVPGVPRVDLAWIPQTIALFHTLQLHVQYEVSELLKALLLRKEATEFVLQATIKLLKKESLDESDSEYEMKLALQYSQQAAAAKFVAVAVGIANAHCDRLVELSVIKALLAVLGNRSHLNSQRVCKFFNPAPFPMSRRWPLKLFQPSSSCIPNRR